MPLGPMDEKGNLPAITQEDVDTDFGLRLKTPEETVADFEASVREWFARAPTIGDGYEPGMGARMVLAAVLAMGLPAVGVDIEEDRIVVLLADAPVILQTVRVA